MSLSRLGGTWMPHGFRECVISGRHSCQKATQHEPAAYLSSCNVRDSWASGTVFRIVGSNHWYHSPRDDSTLRQGETLQDSQLAKFPMCQIFDRQSVNCGSSASSWASSLLSRVGLIVGSSHD